MELAREFGVARLTMHPDGSYEVLFGPPPQPRTAQGTPVDPLAVKRAYYANLLGRLVSDDELGNLPDSFSL